MKLFFVAIAAVFAFSAGAQELPDCEAMYAQDKAAFDAQDASAGNLYQCFAKTLDLSSLNENSTEEQFMQLIIGTCGAQIESVLTVFEPSAVDVLLEAGFVYQLCVMATEAQQ